nr:uncharacterized protein LOC112030644 [Quercus suber]
MTRMFEPHLGKSIEIYIDDMVVKSKIVSEHVKDLENIFEVLRRYKLRLNASKCSFDVGSGKFLGYMVTHKGIEVNPDQIKAINNLQPPWNPREVQKLTGMAIALNRNGYGSKDGSKVSGGVLELKLEFESFNLLHIPRSGNAHTDSLATLATSLAQDLPRVILVKDLHKPMGIRSEVVQVHQIRAKFSWIDLIVKFLKDDILPEEKLEADKVWRKTNRFWLSEEHKLYKRSYSGPYLLCMHPEAAESLFKELHEGICGSHPGDIEGLFPKAAGNKKYLLVGTDYFTKWVEAEPLANIRDVVAKKFIWKNIVTRFGIPHTLI